MPGVDGLVVLVDEDDDLLAVVGVEERGEVEERAGVELPAGAPLDDRPKVADLEGVEAGAREEVEVLAKERFDGPGDGPQQSSKVVALVPLKLRKMTG